MPQEIRVLRCCKCKIFQSDIVKKSKKWRCKICNREQTVSKVYFQGSGADCRQIAQDWNYNEKSKDHEIENAYLDLLDQDNFDVDFEYVANEERKHSTEWAAFTDKSNLQVQDQDEPTKKRKSHIDPDMPSSSPVNRKLDDKNSVL